MGRIIRKAGRLGLPFEEARRRTEKLEKARDEINEQLGIMGKKTTWSHEEDAMRDELVTRLSSITRQITQNRDEYSLHIQEELKQSTATLNRLTMVLIGVTIVLAALTTLLYLKAH